MNELGRLQADDAKGQGARLFGAEIQNSGLQRQFSPGKGPFAVLDPHLLSFEQLIVNDAARDLNARIDAAHAHSLARRRLQAQQVGEMDISRKPSHRAKSRSKAHILRAEPAVTADTVSVPAYLPGARTRHLAIDDNPQRQARQSTRLNSSH